MTHDNYIIIRGPAGTGKTTIAKALVKKLNITRNLQSKFPKPKHISFDNILKKHKLDKINGRCIPAKNFIKANEIIIEDLLCKSSKYYKNARRASTKYNKKSRSDFTNYIVFDGCFYHDSQIKHLQKHLKGRWHVFTLKAPLKKCISRDKKRKHKIGEQSIRAIYKLTKDHGKIINTSNKEQDDIVREIISHIKNIL